jgi:hypothetical protein
MKLPYPDMVASFNHVGDIKANKLLARPKYLKANPLSNFGRSVITNNPLDPGIIVARSDYRDPCFYKNGRLILAASSDHIQIFTTVHPKIIEELDLGDIVIEAFGSLEDL